MMTVEFIIHTQDIGNESQTLMRIGMPLGGVIGFRYRNTLIYSFYWNADINHVTELLLVSYHGHGSEVSLKAKLTDRNISKID
jgi:hypothetical protein